MCMGADGSFRGQRKLIFRFALLPAWTSFSLASQELISYSISEIWISRKEFQWNFACCCLWTGPKHFSKWILLSQLTQCAFYFKFVGRLMSRQILIWNMWRIPSLRRRKRRKHFWKVWMMWVTIIIIISLTQQSAAKRWHHFVIGAGYNSCTLLGPESNI